MLISGIVSILAGAAAIAWGIVDRQNPEILDRWSPNPMIPRGSKGRQQIDSFALVSGAVFLVAGLAMILSAS